MKIYKGTDAANMNWIVMIHESETPEDLGRHLDPRYDLRNHSPDGFSWGYVGSGPAQLALALCADVLDDDVLAQKLYHDFMREVVASLDKDADWTMTEDQIRYVLQDLARDKP